MGTLRRRAVSPAVGLAVGLVLGWTLASMRPAAVHADRSVPGGEDQLASGPVMIQHDRGNDIQVEHDAVYYLDYKGGRLMASVPSLTKTGSNSRMLETFVERDLVADFHLTPGTPDPHFLMTTGTLGALNGAWAPLYVFETSSKQVAVYRLTPQQVGTVPMPKFELLELKSLAKAPAHGQAQTGFPASN